MKLLGVTLQHQKGTVASDLEGKNATIWDSNFGI